MCLGLRYVFREETDEYTQCPSYPYPTNGWLIAQEACIHRHIRGRRLIRDIINGTLWFSIYLCNDEYTSIHGRRTDGLTNVKVGWQSLHSKTHNHKLTHLTQVNTTKAYRALHINSICNANSKRFWRRYVTLRTNWFVDFVYRLEI